jgi:hypothetical protein
MHSIDLLLNKILPMRLNKVVLVGNVNNLNILMLTGSYRNDNTYRFLIIDATKAARRLPPSRSYLLSNYFQETLLPLNLLRRLAFSCLAIARMPQRINGLRSVAGTSFWTAIKSFRSFSKPGAATSPKPDLALRVDHVFAVRIAGEIFSDF